MKTFIYLLLALLILQASYAKEKKIKSGTEGRCEGVAEEEEHEGQEQEEEEEEAVVPGGWQNIDVNEFSNDPWGQEVINFGAQWLINQLGGSVTLNWRITRINSVQSQVVNGMNYKINVLFEDDIASPFTAEFLIYTQQVGPKFQVVSVNYIYGDSLDDAALLEDQEFILPNSDDPFPLQIPPLTLFPIQEEEEEVSTGGGSSMLNLTEAQNDPDIQALVKLGVDSTISNGLANGFLPPGNWTLLSLDQVWEQIVQGVIYTFYVSLTDGQSMRAQASVTVDELFYEEIITEVDLSGFWFVGPVAS